jgi:hypothetical protein
MQPPKFNEPPRCEAAAHTSAHDERSGYDERGVGGGDSAPGGSGPRDWSGLCVEPQSEEERAYVLRTFFPSLVGRAPLSEAEFQAKARANAASRAAELAALPKIQYFGKEQRLPMHWNLAGVTPHALYEAGACADEMEVEARHAAGGVAGVGEAAASRGLKRPYACIFGV